MMDTNTKKTNLVGIVAKGNIYAKRPGQNIYYIYFILINITVIMWFHGGNSLRLLWKKMRSEKSEVGCVSLCCVYSFFS